METFGVDEDGDMSEPIDFPLIVELHSAVRFNVQAACLLRISSVHSNINWSVQHEMFAEAPATADAQTVLLEFRSVTRPADISSLYCNLPRKKTQKHLRIGPRSCQNDEQSLVAKKISSSTDEAGTMKVVR